MFLTIVTRTCQRPRFLQENIQSVKRQTCQDVEQIFIVDREKQGIQQADKSFVENLHRIDSDFTFILDDDCWLINDFFIELLKDFVGLHPEANVVMFKSKRPQGPPSNETIFPAKHVWGKTPTHGTTNCLCYAIKTPIWKEHIEYFGVKPWGGDWWFLEHVIQEGHELFWLDDLMAESRQLGRGKLFESVGSGWFEKVAIEEGLVHLGNDDWRLQLWKQ